MPTGQLQGRDRRAPACRRELRATLVDLVHALRWQCWAGCRPASPTAQSAADRLAHAVEQHHRFRWSAAAPAKVGDEPADDRAPHRAHGQDHVAAQEVRAQVSRPSSATGTSCRPSFSDALFLLSQSMRVPNRIGIEQRIDAGRRDRAVRREPARAGPAEPPGQRHRRGRTRSTATAISVLRVPRRARSAIDVEVHDNQDRASPDVAASRLVRTVLLDQGAGHGPWSQLGDLSRHRA